MEIKDKMINSKFKSCINIIWPDEIKIGAEVEKKITDSFSRIESICQIGPDSRYIQTRETEHDGALTFRLYKLNNGEIKQISEYYKPFPVNFIN